MMFTVSSNNTVDNDPFYCIKEEMHMYIRARSYVYM